jgi:hypothetical protein
MRKRILANGFFCHFLPNGPRCVRDSKTAYDASGIKLRPCQRNAEGVMVSTLPCVTLSRIRFTFDSAVGIKEARGAVMGSISATPNVGNVDSMEGDVFTFPLNAGLPF